MSNQKLYCGKCETECEPDIIEDKPVSACCESTVYEDEYLFIEYDGAPGPFHDDGRGDYLCKRMKEEGF